MTIAIVTGVFFSTMALGVPIAFCLGLASLAGLFTLDNPMFLRLVPQMVFQGMSMFSLMAIPFFILAGEIMNKSQITQVLIRFANVLVGHIRGALAHVNIVSSIFFAGITGAAVADTAALGTILIPAMTKEKYEEDFSAAVTISSSIIGPIIPPSIVMVIYGVTMKESIAALFASGFVPGLLIGLALMAVSYVFARKRGYGRRERAGLREIALEAKNALVGLMIPIIILGGILTGVFTPTEAAAVAVVYGIVTGMFFFRTLKWSDFPLMLKRTAITSSVVLLIIGSANIMGWLLAYQRIPEMLAEAFLSVSDNPYLLLLLMNVLLLIVGMFMEISASIVLLAPILAPIAQSAGIHPLHFALIMLVNLNIGLITPPLGQCIFTVCGITRLKMEQVVKATLPFLLVELAVLLLLTYVPALTLWVPRMLGYVQ
ncbi:TRAP transporter, DctM subunit [Desulfacinum infernum DSM 9756]|uniref:TRAP transporter, DctM subunit n=1 Tax=Desulfacinum infernum DSM 9756 TaxID=1121391 RepID=A0A1M5BQP6_9BACT|nr:TRAP transporter large permease [Desulfacinum infernum]SHF44829.1 TRAP transporter, DctM subunit [Desulfacinum infernum DSM 9756]